METSELVKRVQERAENAGLVVVPPEEALFQRDGVDFRGARIAFEAILIGGVKMPGKPSPPADSPQDAITGFLTSMEHYFDVKAHGGRRTLLWRELPEVRESGGQYYVHCRLAVA